MVWRLVISLILVFGINILFCNTGILFLEKKLLKAQYKFTTKFYYILVYSLIFVLGLFLGGEILYRYL